MSALEGDGSRKQYDIAMTNQTIDKGISRALWEVLGDF
jgi:hypothetical protein